MMKHMRQWWWFLGLALGFPLQVRAQAFGDIPVVRGIEALRRGDDAQALLQLQSVADGPSRGDLWLQARFLAAQAAGNLDLGDQSIAYLNGLEKSLPEVADFVWAQRARVLRAANRWSEAREAWNTILNKYPNSPLASEARYSVADAYYALGDLTHARAAYETAQHLFPRTERTAIAIYNMARIDESRGRLSDAISAYRQLAGSNNVGVMGAAASARLEVLVSTAHDAHASFSQRLGQLDRLLSARSLDEAGALLQDLSTLSLSPTDQQVLMYRAAQHAYRTQDFPKAIALFGQLAAKSSGRQVLEFSRWQANAYAASDHFSDAVALYRNLAARFRNDRDGRELLYRAAWLAYNGGDHALAITLFTDFISRYPRDHAADEAMWYLAWNHYRAGNLPKAADTLVQLRRQYKRSSLIDRTHYWEGRIMAQLGQKSEAQAAYVKASSRSVTYYGFLSEQRLAELNAAPTVTSPETRVNTSQNRVVSATTHDAANDDSVVGPPTPLPAAIGLKPTHADYMPWGTGVFDWESSDGRRALRLMKLGFRNEATKIIRGLPAHGGVLKSAIAYARARILYSLGDYGNAYRIVAANFRDQLQRSPKGPSRRYFQIAYPDAHADTVLAAAREFRISPLLVLAIMRQESAFDDQANSWASARGLMQIIPVTGRRIAEALNLNPYNDGVLRDPVVNVRFGAWYLGQLVQKFEGNYILAIGSYNAGPQAMQRWVDARADCASDEFIEDIPYRETRNYVKSVLTNLSMYAKLYGSDEVVFPDTIPSSYRDNVNF